MNVSRKRITLDRVYRADVQNVWDLVAERRRTHDAFRPSDRRSNVSRAARIADQFI
jgi:hypothetical protein